jgi:hypothetical protein
MVAIKALQSNVQFLITAYFGFPLQVQTITLHKPQLAPDEELRMQACTSFLQRAVRALAGQNQNTQPLLPVDTVVGTHRRDMSRDAVNVAVCVWLYSDRVVWTYEERATGHAQTIAFMDADESVTIQQMGKTGSGLSLLIWTVTNRLLHSLFPIHSLFTLHSLLFTSVSLLSVSLLSVLLSVHSSASVLFSLLLLLCFLSSVPRLINLDTLELSGFVRGL